MSSRDNQEIYADEKQGKPGRRRGDEKQVNEQVCLEKRAFSRCADENYGNR